MRKPIKRRIAGIDYLVDVIDNINEDPELTIISILPYSFVKVLGGEMVLDKVLIILKDES